VLVSIRQEAFDLPAPVQFRDGDHVLICKHVFENHYRGILYFRHGGAFNREDGAIGGTKFNLYCPACSKIPPAERDHHEWVWKRGVFWLADALGTSNAIHAAQPGTPEVK
jgi:hypothetical protein